MQDKNAHAFAFATWIQSNFCHTMQLVKDVVLLNNINVMSSCLNLERFLNHRSLMLKMTGNMLVIPYHTMTQKRMTLKVFGINARVQNVRHRNRVQSTILGGHHFSQLGTLAFQQSMHSCNGDGYKYCCYHEKLQTTAIAMNKADASHKGELKHRQNTY